MSWRTTTRALLANLMQRLWLESQGTAVPTLEGPASAEAFA